MLTSHKLAQLAGTTVRTLRHYHCVGVLQEPPRDPNGYRRYSAQDLVTVLRIRRMASLGFSLEQIRSILTARSGSNADEITADLDALDVSLAEQIARLQAQRDLIARIRASQVEPDLPPELGRVFRLFEDHNVDAAWIETQKQLAVLVAHLLPDGVSTMRDVLLMLGSGKQLQKAVELDVRIEKVDDSTTDMDRAQLLEELVAFIAPVIAQVKTTGCEDKTLKAVVESVSFGSHGMNTAQAELLRVLTERLERATGQPA